MKNIKLKDMITQKRTLLDAKRVLDTEINNIRVEKKKLHDELLALKGNWKLCLNKSKDLQLQIDTLSTDIKMKRANGKRGFRLSGLSIDIRNNLDTKIIDFFKLNKEEPISRILVMKSIFEYIRTHELYKDGDRRFIDLNSSSPYLKPIIDLFDMDIEGDAFRIQRFRSYLENFINT